MVEAPLPANKDENEVNAALKNVNSAFVKVMSALIISRVPFLGFAFPKFFLNLLLGWLDSFFVKGEEQIADDLIVDGQISLEMSAKAVAFKNILVAEKSGDPDAIKKAIQAYADANSALTHMDGVATTH